MSDMSDMSDLTDTSNMSRRGFLKWSLLLIGMIGAGVAALLQLLQMASRETLFKPAGRDPSPYGTAGEAEVAESSEPAAPEVDLTVPLLSFWILSDLHVTADGPAPSKHLRRALKDVTQFGGEAAFIAFTGDITDTGRERDYKELATIFNEYPLPPYYANMGNHDYYNIWINKEGQWATDHVPNGKTDQQSREDFMRFFKMEKTYGDVWVDGYHILLLSQETYIQERPDVKEGAWYSDEQLDWFKRKLAEHQGDPRPVFVMIHQPLPAIGRDGGSHQLIRAKEFREIVAPYPNVFVFCGHGHRDFQSGFDHYVQETFHCFHNSSVGRVLNRNFQESSALKSQGIYLQVYADRVVVRGREFSDSTWISEADWTIPLTSNRV